MKHLCHIHDINDTKKLLALSLDNLVEINKILKNLAHCDSVDLLFYDKDKSQFYDKINKNTISLSYLQKDTKSIIGKAYLEKTPLNSYIRYDHNYNISLDNPYKLNISSQVIFPLIRENIVIGIIRFSKFKYTFEQGLIDILEMLRGSLNDVFSLELDNHIEQGYETFFNIDKHEVQTSIGTIHDEFTKLVNNTYNPEIKKLIERAEDNVKSINEYIKIKLENINQKQIAEESKPYSNGVRVLIADDVHMNVKILNAMIKDKNEDNLDIHFAYDGIETLNKIDQANRENKDINILFLDHYMPGMLGLEVAKDIREKERNFNKNKTVIVSITNDPNAISKEKKLYDYHLPKPFVKLDIINIMSEIKRLSTVDSFQSKMNKLKFQHKNKA